MAGRQGAARLPSIATVKDRYERPFPGDEGNGYPHPANAGLAGQGLWAECDSTKHRLPLAQSGVFLPSPGPVRLGTQSVIRRTPESKPGIFEPGFALTRKDQTGLCYRELRYQA
jgi:hypothetical protein